MVAKASEVDPDACESLATCTAERAERIDRDKGEAFAIKPYLQSVILLSCARKMHRKIGLSFSVELTFDFR